MFSYLIVRKTVSKKVHTEHDIACVVTDLNRAKEIRLDLKSGNSEVFKQFEIARRTDGDDWVIVPVFSVDELIRRDREVMAKAEADHLRSKIDNREIAGEV